MEQSDQDLRLEYARAGSEPEPSKSFGLDLNARSNQRRIIFLALLIGFYGGYGNICLVDSDEVARMGIFRVGCQIQHVIDTQKTVEIKELMVDSNSTSTWLPGKVLKRLGVEGEKDIEITTANGQGITRTVGYVIIRCDQFQTVDEVVFAELGDMSLLGARTLSGFNVAIDSKEKKLAAAGPILAA